MGQKANPIGLRLGINRTWDSRWFARKNDYSRLLHEDMKIRGALMAVLRQASVARIIIERPHDRCRVTIHSARPGVVIGKKGADIDKLRRLVAKITSAEVTINVTEVRRPELDATLVAESIAQQLERRVAFRRSMKRAIQSAMRLGAEGIRINCSGRLGGAEIARLEWYREGRVPLHTLRADVDYGVATANTAYGTCGVKVWIFKGEILDAEPDAPRVRAADDRSSVADKRSLRLARVAVPREPPKAPGPLPPQQRRDVVAPPPSTPDSFVTRVQARSSGSATEDGPPPVLARSGPVPAKLEPPIVASTDEAPDRKPEQHERGLPDASWPEDAEREMMRAFNLLSTKAGTMVSVDGLDRREAIDALVQQGRIVTRDDVVVPRSLSKRVAAIMPTLFESLFDPVSEVRWAAAYGIAALRSPQTFKSVAVPTNPDEQLKSAVIAEVTQFLHERKTHYITEVDLTAVRRSDGKMSVSGVTIVYDRMPLDLAGSRPVLAKSRRAPTRRGLEVEVSDVDGRIVGVFEQPDAVDQVASGRSAPNEGALATCAFSAELDDRRNLTLHVKVTFGGHRLRTHLVKVDDDAPITVVQD